jgi:hypothetical protein
MLSRKWEKIVENLGIPMGISYRYQNKGVAWGAICMVIILKGLENRFFLNLAS